ncbi:MAG: hypothetical protein KDA87_22570 [Planctomycetales bacterium]|nr:hypothetical protein [Planctomycetales bacterium]
MSKRPCRVSIDHPNIISSVFVRRNVNRIKQLERLCLANERTNPPFFRLPFTKQQVGNSKTRLWRKLTGAM